MEQKLDLGKRFKLENESSMMNWYPKIKGILRTPKTVIVPFTEEELSEIRRTLDGKMLSDKLIEKIYSGADEIGFPLFMRSDQASGKHEWKDTCFVPTRADLIGHLVQLVEWHECADLFGIRWKALVFRELLELDSTFTAFNGMPVARERRCFVMDGDVICSHPYWPEESIVPDRHAPLPGDWKDRLARLNEEKPDEVEILHEASLFGEVVHGYWSVDFACDVNGVWWMIDAARGEISWHPGDCPFCPEDQRPGEILDFDKILVKREDMT